DFRGVSAAVTTGDSSGTIGGATISMHVHENVALNPSVRPIQIKAVVLRTGENVVNELNDRRAGAVAAGEIHDVAVTDGAAEEVPQENAVGAAFEFTRATYSVELSA